MPINSSSKYLRSINFDLDTKFLLKYFGKNYRSSTYSKIKKFMSINNFEHRQGSGYLSGVPLSRDEVWVIIRRLNKTYPWIKRFAKDIILTNVEGQFDIKQQLKIEEKARQKFRSKR